MDWMESVVEGINSSIQISVPILKQSMDYIYGYMQCICMLRIHWKPLRNPSNPAAPFVLKSPVSSTNVSALTSTVH